MNYFLEHQLTTTAIAFGVIILVLAWAILDIRSKWSRMFGKRPANDALADVIHRLVQAEHSLIDIEPRLRTVEGIGQIAIQRMGFMRFNPFEHTGSDQSFALALLDHTNNGVVISSLYTREGVRVYAKEIQNGTSKHQLSHEETTVLSNAMASKPL
jgi:hypothetical protein